MIVLTVIIYTGSLVLSGFLFYWFESCTTNVIMICATLLVGVACFILVLVKTRPDSSIFTSSMVFLYTTYLVWSAMGSRPDPECNSYIVSNTNTICQIVFGLFFAVLALLVTSAVSKRESAQDGGLT